VQQLARAIRADLTLIVHDAHDKEPGSSFLLLFLLSIIDSIRSFDFQGARRNARDNGEHALCHGIGVVQFRLSARDAHFDGAARGKKIPPRQFFRPPLELVKGAGVKSSEPDHHTTCGAEPEIRLVDAIKIATKGDSSDFLSSFDAERIELAGGD
jgi:hypothetical protein